MHPIMFTINNKAWIFQRGNNINTADQNIADSGLKEEQVMMIMGGNVLSEQMLQDNHDISDELVIANNTCEYIPM